MKNQAKGFVKGVLVTIFVLAFVITASAAIRTAKATLSYNDIKICIDGNYITPKDAGGNVVEPFIINGTTYLPVRAVASALGKEVDWDGNTATVFLGKKPTTTVVADGSRSKPFDATNGVSTEYNTYSFYPTREFNIQCTKVIKGEAGSILAGKASSANGTANGKQEWIFFDFQIKFVSSSDGEDDEFEAYNLISYYDPEFYTASGSKITVASRASFYSFWDGLSTSDLKLFPGGSGRAVVGILTDKINGDILLKVPYAEGKKYTWIKLNSEANTISTKAQLDAYLDEESPEAEQSVTIICKTTLPKNIDNYSYGNKLEATIKVTDFEYTVSGTTAKITFIGEKTYDADGAGQSRAAKVGWKLYDSDGYVIDDGTASSTSIKKGEKFKNCTDTIYSLEPGEYTLEFMSVN